MRPTAPGRPTPPRTPPPSRFKPRRFQEEQLKKAIGILEKLVDEFPSVPDYRDLLARCCRELPPPPPWGRGGAGRPPRKSLARAEEILEKLVRDFPSVPDYRYDLSETYAKVEIGRPPFSAEVIREAEERLGKALEISGELGREQPNIPLFLVQQVSLNFKLHDLYFKAGRFERAAKALDRAFGLQERLVRRYPEVKAYKVWLSTLYLSRARLLRAKGEREFIEAVLELSRRKLSRSRMTLAEAGRAFEECTSRLEECMGKEGSPWYLRDLLAGSLHESLSLLLLLGDDAAAENVRSRLLKLREELKKGSGFPR